MVTNTANRPSHERVKHTKIIITNNLSHKYSLVDFEPSGTVAQCLGLQDIWDIWNLQETVQGSTNTSGMTLWHAGTLLAWLACWHSRQTHGTGTLMMTHNSLTLGRLCWHTQDDVVSLWLMMMVIYGDLKLIY